MKYTLVQSSIKCHYLTFQLKSEFSIAIGEIMEEVG